VIAVSRRDLYQNQIGIIWNGCRIARFGSFDDVDSVGSACDGDLKKRMNWNGCSIECVGIRLID
jgi:hypothetical protein